ncbi:TetR/AcrR family transcriptional regulator [Dyadobacter psychrophilus]|uniref:Transcriptional regulator, TetR family n=1 Tax=Dyadobacter psychrophilus TaxID=651661 RepID=A0A1T5DID2_9BACT|nr:TetR/AcrR family transcriptional regulator [Dyadobacter psychrophilus]SKB71474.1 transcriptional regulator, TetR family [Dyadobacter psychrophilus]
MNATQEKIINRALELFNQKGIEYVGMRELAADLDMRIGNLTYYFPTKNDLVYSLSQAYTESNNQIHKELPVKSLHDFLKKNVLLFENGLKYQCLMLSMVHLMEQNTLIATNYKNVMQNRASGLMNDVAVLEENKYVKFAGEDDKLLIVSSNSLQNRFWFSEAVLSGSRQNLASQMTHYLRMKAHLFRPYATKKGIDDIERFLSELS